MQDLMGRLQMGMLVGSAVTVQFTPRVHNAPGNDGGDVRGELKDGQRVGKDCNAT